MLHKITLVILVFIFGSFQGSSQTTRVEFVTTMGKFTVLLYDFTPHHKALFLKEIEKGSYKRALFNRVVANFVVQGGEHDVDIERREQRSGRSEGRLAPEFDAKAFHKVGALGAGRDDNKEKASFLKQIYFVVGRPYTSEQLDSLALKYNKTYTEEQKNIYTTLGGQPRLDGDYTVFGEVIDGLDVLIKISQLPVDKNHYPIKRIRFEVRVLP